MKQAAIYNELYFVKHRKDKYTCRQFMCALQWGLSARQITAKIKTNVTNEVTNAWGAWMIWS